MCAVAYGSYIWKPGSLSATWSSHDSFLRSTNMASAVAVNAFVSEPIGKAVCASTISCVPSLRTP